MTVMGVFFFTMVVVGLAVVVGLWDCGMGGVV